MGKIKFFKFAVVFAIIALFTVSASAQKEKTIPVGKNGNFHIGSRLMVGDKTIKAGMYKMEHLIANREHFIVIRLVKMNRYVRGMGNLKLGDEVARVKGTAGRGTARNRNSVILTRRDATGKRVAHEVWFRGENVVYVLPAH